MKAALSSPASGTAKRSSYLPDFCNPQAALVVVLLAVLIALVLALARQTDGRDFWTDLARMSAYVLWNAVLSAALLCRAGAWLGRQTLRKSSLAALGIILGTVALVSESIFWFGRGWDARLGAATGIFPAEHWSFLVPNLLIGAAAGAGILRYFYVTSAWRRSVELEARARLHALQARVQPHFLYNSLNTIASLTRTDPVRAEEAVEDLADLFRVSLVESRPQSSLREELESVRKYERIEQLRLGNRLTVRWDVDALPGNAVVPALMLQSLLETAIVHAIEHLADGGAVTVVGRVDNGMMALEVGNPAADPPPEAVREIDMALENIRRRLDLIFPGRSSVTILEEAATRRVILRFPLVHALQEGAHL